MKIGIYCGSFNPVHNAHLQIANKLLDERLVDRVVFVPAGDDYEKKGLVCAYHREEMLKIVLANNERIMISDEEIENGKLFTYQTLDYFKSVYKDNEIYLVIGVDNLKEFHLWKQKDYILRNYNIIVINRNGLRLKEFKEYSEYKNMYTLSFDSDISSTKIRKLIKNEKFKELELLLNKDVLAYIRRNGLYE